MIDIEAYHKLKKEASEKSKKAWEEYQKVSTIRSEVILKLVDLKGKYIKTTEGDYLFVSEEFETKWQYSSEIPAVLLRGLGFSYSYTPYWDDTYVNWDRGYQVWIRLDKDFESDARKITEITKEEFNQAFDKMLEGLKYYHYDNCSETY